VSQRWLPQQRRDIVQEGFEKKFASENASSGDPASQVSNCLSLVSKTGMRSWLIVATSAFGVAVRNE
jgi:hypothetical protein